MAVPPFPMISPISNSWSQFTLWPVCGNARALSTSMAVHNDTSAPGFRCVGYPSLARWKAIHVDVLQTAWLGTPIDHIWIVLDMTCHCMPCADRKKFSEDVLPCSLQTYHARAKMVTSNVGFQHGTVPGSWTNIYIYNMYVYIYIYCSTIYIYIYIDSNEIYNII